MGVKDLWNIISPLCERKPLYELEGKTIAIDLSCWVVDSQNFSPGQPKMYLRNLFFRTSYFLLHDVTPVFVLEGEAPALKHNTIARRNENRAQTEGRKTSKKGGRTHFNTVLKECQELLKFMGIRCFQSPGEAEALCAYLNEDGLVDGCISQDSDCFLYGAKIVYRNFCTVKQGNSGSIDEYSIEKIERVLGLGRNKMIALALICGCDYDEGLHGVGKEAALKLFKTINDDEILERMKQWKTSSHFDKIEKELSNPDICTNCGHSGKVRSHTKIGCIDCGTSVKCNDSYKEKRILISNELSIRKHARAKDNFPNQEIIDEFLVRKGSTPTKLDLKWEKPNIVKFIGFMERVVQWDSAYAIEKIVPMVTRWQLLNSLEIEDFFPKQINKVRRIRGVLSYEIIWIDKKNILQNFILPKDEENSNEELVLMTIEPQYLVEKCYPEIVENFQKSKKPQKRANNEKRKAKNKNTIKNKKITDFLAVQELEDSFGKMEITPKRKKNPQIERVMTTEKLDSILNGSLERIFNELTPEDFPSENEISDSEMSEIIESICKKVQIF